MTIKKYQGNSKEEAIALAKKELGPNAEIMNVDEKKSGGFLGIGKKAVFEVTAMIDEDTDSKQMNASKPHFDAVADQDIKVPPVDRSSAEELEETKRQFAELSKIFRENENSNEVKTNKDKI